MADNQTGLSKRGFAAMDQEKVREIARKGGRSMPSHARSFSKNPELAAAAGRKGGQSVSPYQRSFSRNNALASGAGRKGGSASRRSPHEKDTGEARATSLDSAVPSTPDRDKNPPTP